MSSKLNWLLNHSVAGEIILQSWLSDHEISPQLAYKYAQNQWLSKLRTGVYYRPGAIPQWQNAVYCLNHQSGIHAHLAGLTSLSQQGKAHYLQFSTHSVWLGIPSKFSLPTWFKGFVKMKFSAEHNVPKWQVIRTSKLTHLQENDFIIIDIHGVKLQASNQELAAFEVLDAVPNILSFEHAAELFQGLNTLSPSKVESLLQRSTTIQTNRLFLFLGHFYKHPWVERIDESKIHLGSGKRQIVANGKLDRRYQISVPQEFIESDENYG